MVCLLNRKRKVPQSYEPAEENAGSLTDFGMTNSRTSQRFSCRVYRTHPLPSDTGLHGNATSDIVRTMLTFANWAHAAYPLPCVLRRRQACDC